MPAPGDGERTRITRVFTAYRDDARRQRAWSAENPGNAAIREEVARATLAVLAEHDPGGLVLDAGCGTGWWLARLRQAGVAPDRLVGVELQPGRATAARDGVPGVSVLCADIRALPIASASCALVTLFTVLSSMGCAADIDAALAEARRVLVPGGAVVVWEPRVITRNPNTRLVRRRELRRTLGPRMRSRSITLAPAVARRAGRAYGALSAVPALRSHRLVVARAAHPAQDAEAAPRPGGSAGEGA